MAEDKTPKSVELIFPVLSRGWGPYESPRTMGPEGSGPLWRESLNALFQDGLVVGRSVLVGTGLGSHPDVPINDRIASVEGETPLYIQTFLSPLADTFASPGGSCAAQRSYLGANKSIVLVTNRQAYVFKGVFATGTWTNVTPTYTTETLTATNGSATITGAGTAWLTRGISPYQLIEIDGAWYELCTVTGDTAATISPVFAGATGAGKTYTIRRTWRGGPGPDRHNLVFSQIFNGDLYIAGTFLARADGQIAPAVIRVADILETPTAGTYLTAATDLTGTLDLALDATGALLADISGLQAMQDGRVVLLANGHHVVYSSHLDTSVWTAAPGGAEPLTQRPGPAFALGAIGRILTCHFADGIVLGTPTGQDDPPLAFQASAATEGATAPRSLRTQGGREFYMGADGQFHVFDLAQSMTLDTAPWRSYNASLGTIDLRVRCHAAVDGQRDRYMAFIQETESSNSYTRAFFLDTVTLQWSPLRFATPITACSDRNDLATFQNDSHLLVGMPSHFLGTSRTMLWSLSDSNVADTAPALFAASPTADATTTSLTTDSLDFGYPGYLKTIHCVRLWITPAPDRIFSDQSITVTIQNQSTSTLAVELSQTRAVNSSDQVDGTELYLRFFFAPTSREYWRVKISTQSDILKSALFRMSVEAMVTMRVDTVDG